MTSASIQARFAAATGYMPVNTASFAETAYSGYVSENPQALVGAKQLSETSPDMLSVTVGPSRDFYMEIMNQVSSMLTEKKSPESVVKSMSRALNLLLSDYAAANGE
jgi:ABC-type glycerol-3-phosphate transport system substrate-binding protein